MNQDMKSYKQVISGLLDEICADEAEAIQKAAQVMGDSIMRGQVIHVIGPGGPPTWLWRRCFPCWWTGVHQCNFRSRNQFEPRWFSFYEG